MDRRTPPDLDELYDPSELARIERGSIHAEAPGASGAFRRRARETGLVDRIDELAGELAAEVAGHGGDAWSPASAEPPEAGAIESGEPSPAGASLPTYRRSRLAGAMLAGAMLGIGEVLEPDKARQHIIDYRPDHPDESGQLVTFHLVPGDPRASRIVVRPWLLDRFRRSHR